MAVLFLESPPTSSRGSMSGARGIALIPSITILIPLTKALITLLKMLSILFPIPGKILSTTDPSASNGALMRSKISPPREAKTPRIPSPMLLRPPIILLPSSVNTPSQKFLIPLKTFITLLATPLTNLTIAVIRLIPATTIVPITAPKTLINGIRISANTFPIFFKTLKMSSNAFLASISPVSSFASSATASLIEANTASPVSLIAFHTSPRRPEIAISVTIMPMTATAIPIGPVKNAANALAKPLKTGPKAKTALISDLKFLIKNVIVAFIGIKKNATLLIIPKAINRAIKFCRATFAPGTVSIKLTKAVVS